MKPLDQSKLHPGCECCIQSENRLQRALDSEAREYDAYEELKKVKKEKTFVYWERNQLVAFISKVLPASLERHPEDEEWEDDWRWIVFIDGPFGQLSWHIHDSDLQYFSHLQRNQGRKWDGHTTERKYARLALAKNLPDRGEE